MNSILVTGLSIVLMAAPALLAANSSTAGAPATRSDAAKAWSQEGLQPVRARDLDLAYARAGSDWSQYRQVLLQPVQVTFHRGWERSAQPLGTRIPIEDAQRIGSDVAAVVHEEVAREFQRGGYQVVTSPGAGVLEVRVQVTDLHLNAPNFQTASPTSSYATSFGEMTLVAELRDSTDGPSLMRVFDHIRGPDFGAPRRITRVENAHEVGVATARWARALRREMSALGPSNPVSAR